MPWLEREIDSGGGMDGLNDARLFGGWRRMTGARRRRASPGACSGATTEGDRVRRVRDAGRSDEVWGLGKSVVHVRISDMNLACGRKNEGMGAVARGEDKRMRAWVQWLVLEQKTDRE